MTIIFAYIFYAYLFVGLLFGIWFVIRGVGEMDANAGNAGWGLRLLWLPGAIAMWPILARKSFSK